MPISAVISPEDRPSSQMRRAASYLCLFGQIFRLEGLTSIVNPQIACLELLASSIEEAMNTKFRKAGLAPKTSPKCNAYSISISCIFHRHAFCPQQEPNGNIATFDAGTY